MTLVEAPRVMGQLARVPGQLGPERLGTALGLYQPTEGCLLPPGQGASGSCLSRKPGLNCCALSPPSQQESLPPFSLLQLESNLFLVPSPPRPLHGARNAKAFGTVQPCH